MRGQTYCGCWEALFIALFFSSSLLCNLHNVEAQQTVLQMLIPQGYVSFATAINNFEDLVSLLNNSSQISTAFAPTEAAWTAAKADIPTDLDKLHALLLYHLAAGSIYVTNITTTDNQQKIINSRLILPTLKDQPQVLVATTSGSVVSVNDAQISTADTVASNGVIQGIEAVLFPPPENITALISASYLDGFYGWIEGADMLKFFDAKGITVLGPTDEAIAALPDALQEYLLLDSSIDTLKEFLLYHTINESTVYIPNLPMGGSTILSSSGQDITFYRQAYGTTINNGVAVLEQDLLATNGVLHTLDQVLLPPSFVFSIEIALAGLGTSDFLHLMKEHGLEDILTGQTNYTVFAPTNESLALENDYLYYYTHEALTAILKNHIIVGSVDDLTAGSKLKTLSGQVLVVAQDGVTIHLEEEEERHATVLVNLTTSTANGVAYVIDGVLYERKEDYYYEEEEDKYGITTDWRILMSVSIVVGVIFVVGGGSWYIHRWYQARRYTSIGGDEI